MDTPGNILIMADMTIYQLTHTKHSQLPGNTLDTADVRISVIGHLIIVVLDSQLNRNLISNKEHKQTDTTQFQNFG